MVRHLRMMGLKPSSMWQKTVWSITGAGNVLILICPSMECHLDRLHHSAMLRAADIMAVSGAWAMKILRSCTLQIQGAAITAHPNAGV